MKTEFIRVKAFTQNGIAKKIAKNIDRLKRQGFNIVAINQYGYIAIGRNKAGTIFYNK